MRIGVRLFGPRRVFSSETPPRGGSWRDSPLALAAALALSASNNAPLLDGETGDAPGPVVYLDPEPDAVEPLRAAIARWEAAGVRPGMVYAAPGGAPVTTPNLDGGGYTARRVSEITHVKWVEVRTTRQRTWVHEVGHVLGAIGHVPCDTGADPSDRPVMCDQGGWILDETSLALICSRVPCDFFAPDEP